MGTVSRGPRIGALRHSAEGMTGRLREGITGRLRRMPWERAADRRKNGSLVSLMLAGLAGAAVAFLLDPHAGRRRRKVGRDRLLSLIPATGRKTARIARRLGSAAYGRIQRVSHPRSGQRGDLDDATLADKVQSELFRGRDIPKGNVNVNVERGVVVLRGELEDLAQITELTEEARRIPGVRGVESLLHLTGESRFTP